ncbi:MAG: 50S ribosomal protein L29 [Parcubacteria group bacterium GW2011_GWC1_45_9]|nr:MAG: 50S ribosomal protein L29 [Parcubacteria group bacterium GW2011_GWA1_Parcubacteria_45_10]KKT88469.1 MAG: 50S ribosomal protein L29 [Parcubacteria group bacterium GW2011_GWB1_45_10]KKU17305.1 MAG: 50S ribosomal protein L29 [Parcubacteria group bacterium GW2011_GWC1_45_9]HCI05214.1 50S ribosomal protein L29 [Patescibacteria group bacterium]
MKKSLDLENKTIVELAALITDQKKKLQDLSFDLKLGKLQNTSQIGKLKKEIARIKLVLKLKHGKKV